MSENQGTTASEPSTLLDGWNRRAREIKSVVEKIDNNLHLVRRKGFHNVPEGVRRSHDISLAIRTQFFDNLID